MRSRQKFRGFHPDRWTKVSLRGIGGGVRALNGVKALNGVNVRVSLQWKRLSNRLHRIRRRSRLGRLSINVRPNSSWQVYFLSSLPLRSLSRIWGQFNRANLPTFLRYPGFKLYSWVFRCNLDELKDPDLTHYRNFQDFFCRELRPEVRPVDPDSLVVSPVDGRIVCQGVVDNNYIEHVKGLSYSLEALLGGVSTVDPAIVDFRQDITSSLLKKHKEFASNYSIPPYHDRCSHFRNDNGLSTKDPLTGSDTQSQSETWNNNNSTRDSYYDNCCPFNAFQDVTSDTSSVLSDASDISTDSFYTSIMEDDDDVPLDDSNGTTHPILDNGKPNWDVWVQEADVVDIDSLPWRNIQPNNLLFYSVIYLAPGDYHRFHSPADWVIESRRHFSGELFSVSPFLARRLHNLFVLNERVALLGRYKHGFMSMIPVGATNVGSIVIDCDPTLSTNRMVLRKKSLGSFQEAAYSDASPILNGVPINRGEQLGRFQLGSTVVLVFEAPADFKFSTHQGQYVRVGEGL
ncbi:phosphatidylserine decarboxylase Psd2 [Schizosaccharomyces cryophilus OY26]|uniref:Phosphatidylserine decarboxylase proenzyme 1, mitochondrial n=1 Tax=Schizosaccharomyces cryophilus (strain OY26 / ATCC MYA-4695 / CBS 11777 / NBRC 106824 / NRRL Y48691) TaxID=653667 RepID=S9X2W0_SCHCR|nr:phosphatidylserine decarboxylase Psd2 [Schizosaccharomyces cryophilus OY26]EPY51422.1 phosphatidylserine decarboxylase Psd2 [Schizosaccharomyces cryophilus OY26]